MRGYDVVSFLFDSVSSSKKPQPIDGVEIASISLCCAFIMTVGTYHGFRYRWRWFPCRQPLMDSTGFFTALVAAMQITVDRNTPMPRPIDQLSKLSGTALLCTMMGHFMPALCVMDRVSALTACMQLLVAVMIVNVGIQMRTGEIHAYLPEHAMMALCMLLLLSFLISSSLTASTNLRRLEKLYQVKRKELDGDEGEAGNTNDKLKEYVEKYWLLAHSGSPQNVLGRSAACTASGAVCVLSALILAETTVRSFLGGRSRSPPTPGTPDFGWSIVLVVISQEIAVAVGTIAPAFRWFTAVRFKSLAAGSRSWRDEIRVEKHWAEKLTDWKEASLHLQIRNWRCQRMGQTLKNLTLGLLIKVQMGVVLASKLVCLISVLLVSWLDHGTNKLFRKLQDGNPSCVTGSSNLEEFVLHLEGEEDLVKPITRDELTHIEARIQMWKKKSPKCLASLIRQRIHSADWVRGFIWVGRFDGNGVVPLFPEGKEPQHCWALPVVTLACITAALPGIDQSSLESLLSGVGEGLRYVRQIEKNLAAKGLANQREAADRVWSHLRLYSRWFDWDLRRLTAERQTSRRVIEELRRIGETCVREFLRGVSSEMMSEDSLDWPPTVLAANCMYRLTSTILQDCDRDPRLEKHLFCCRLRKAICDLLGACLTNLPRSIYQDCFCNTIEEREVRVRVAASLFGEAEEIMSMLGDQRASSLYPEEKAYVENWREKIGNSSEWDFDSETCSALATVPSSDAPPSSPASISSKNTRSFTADESFTSGDLAQQHVPPGDIV